MALFPNASKLSCNDGNIVGKREFLRFCMSDEICMLGFMVGGNGATWQ
jgi:hypothetical protein